MITPSALNPAHGLSFAAGVSRVSPRAPISQPLPPVKDPVTLSVTAKSINEEAISQAIWAGDPTPVQQPDDALPPLLALLLNPEEAQQRAEAGLKEAMRQLGIPDETSMTITTTHTGDIKVEGDFAGRETLENLINNTMDLRNVLGTAQRSIKLARIVAAAEKASAAAEANPAGAVGYYNGLVQRVQQIISMPTPLEMKHGHLAPRLTEAEAAQQVGVHL